MLANNDRWEDIYSLVKRDNAQPNQLMDYKRKVDPQVSTSMEPHRIDPKLINRYEDDLRNEVDQVVEPISTMVFTSEVGVKKNQIWNLQEMILPIYTLEQQE